MIDPRGPDFSCTPASARRPRFEYATRERAAAPIVSIVTPFHDPGAAFRETARCVLQQSLQEWEWIVVNDCSTEPLSLALLDELRESDSRIRVVDHAANRGPGAARNTGFAAARGRYVLMLDSDDQIEPTAAEIWLWYLETHPAAGFVKGFTVNFDGETYLWEGGFHDGARFLEANQVQTTSMIRRQVHAAAGGFDEVNRGGLEDWDFWLRCAAAGYWGDTVPEYLDWYRRRATHVERWPNWDEGPRQRDFRNGLRARFPRLFDGGFPVVANRFHEPHEVLTDELPLSNSLAKRRQRLLLVAPWLTTGGADKFNLDLVRQLTARGWEVTVATTLRGDHAWLPEFTAVTPDVFVLSHFLPLPDAPRFLRYLIQSRDVDAVLTSHSELAYRLLPYLRAHCPKVAFLDYCHIEEPEWNNGGYPALSVRYQEQLDLSIVSSQHLAGWMTRRGADPSRIAVATTNVDADAWRPDSEARQRTRRELAVAGETPVILFAGRLVAQKQPRVLASTLSRLAKLGAEFSVVVAGDGPERYQLQYAIAGAGLQDRMRWLGAVPTARMRELMAAADVFFLPSRWEGISLSLFEAMACGLAVVAADVGGQRELVDAECGVLVASSDEESEAEAYAQALAPLLADAQMRRRLGACARARVTERFRLDQMGETMNELILRAGESCRTRPRPILSRSLGRALAEEAVEYARLYDLSVRLWASGARDDGAPSGVGVRSRLFAWAYRVHEPLFHWYSRRGWTWPAPLRARVKAWLGASS